MTIISREVNEITEFEVGKIYIRKEIHDKYGGQWQVGISALKNCHMNFLFAGISEKQGYENGFRPDGSFGRYVMRTTRGYETRHSG